MESIQRDCHNPQFFTSVADLSRKLMNYIIRSYAKDAKPSLDLHQPTAGWFPNNRDASVVY